MKKLSNKILLAGLVVLVGIFVASRFFRSPGLESNLRKDLLTLDTAKIDEIKILPSKERTEELRLVREGNLWKVIKGTRQEPASKSSVKNLLSSLNMEAQQMVSRKKEKWEEFNVGNNSTHVTVFSEGNKRADFHVGRATELSGRDRVIYRLLEILPGFASWSTLIGVILMSIYAPFFAASANRFFSSPTQA